MINKYFFWLTSFLVLLLSISSASANNTCTFKGQKYVVIEFNVVGDPGTYQSLVVEEKGGIEQVLWYTEEKSSESDHFFNEQSLKSDVPYKVRIIREPGNNIAVPTYYYRKNMGLGVNSWMLVDEMKMSLKSGQITASTKISGAELVCADVEEEDIAQYVPPTFDQCTYFPQAIQSWKTEGTVYESYGPSSFTANSGTEKITGWTDNYINDSANLYEYEPWTGAGVRTALRIGFDKTNNSNTYYASCQGLGCGTADLNDDGLYETRKSEAPEPINVSFESTDELKIDTYYTADHNQALCASNGTLCTFVEQDDHYELTILNNLKSLDITNLSSAKTLQVRFAPGVMIEKLATGAPVELYFDENTGTLFGSLSLGWGTDVYLGSNAIIGIAGDGDDSTVDLETSNPLNFYPVYSESGADYKKPTIYGPDASFHLKVNGTLEAYLLAKRMNFDVGISVKGSITAHTLNVVGDVTVVADEHTADCWEGSEIEEEYTLVLSPATDVALVCENLTSTLSVMSNGSLASSFSGTATVTVDGVNTSVAITNGTGDIALLSGGESKTISVSATLDNYPDTNGVSGSYQFVPFKFAVDDQYVIANKAQDVEVKVLACSNNTIDLVNNYSGQPTVSSNWVAPANGVGDLIYQPNFTNGTNSAQLTLEDSGQMEVTLEDSNFDCTGLDACPIDQGETGTGTLKGKFTVYSRPWTFAICSAENTDLDSATGDSNSGNGFIAAGEMFAAKVLPIRYPNQGQGATSGEVESGSLCSENITSNFFLNNTPDNNVALSSSVATPVQSDDEVFKVEQSRTNGDKQYTFTDLSWSDVGSLKVMASTANYSSGSDCSQASGLSSWYECTQRGYRKVGRFYPAKLVLQGNQWDYAAGHDDFMYMNQADITYDFVVEAQNTQGGATSNYGAFDASLIADIELFAVDRNSTPANQDLTTRIDTLGYFSWDGNSGWSEAQLKPVYRNFLFKRKDKEESSSSIATVADGPYTDGFGLVVTNSPDGVNFVFDGDCDDSQQSNECSDTSHDIQLEDEQGNLLNGKLFTTQPDIRYGRMVMSDVGGTSVSTINIPLRVEYWDGTRFTLNEDDSASEYNSDSPYVCQQLIWSASESSNASLQTVDAGVNHGKGSELFAIPHSNTDNAARREQIRFWLKLDDDQSQNNSPQISDTDVSCGGSYLNQPWLQYNWWNRGDEDPSAVVTFGVHRGNDRIIFRGESGLTGQ